jgi:hypothetical protein
LKCLYLKPKAKDPELDSLFGRERH